MPFELNPDETGNLFLCPEEMPCGPRQIKIFYWDLPETLDQTECEEAAARLIAFSQHFGAWVGVSWSRIVEMLCKDIELFSKAMDASLKGVVAPDFPSSLIYTLGTSKIFFGFQQLRHQGMVRIEHVGDGSIIYPTEKLLLRIMEVQKIAA